MTAPDFETIISDKASIEACILKAFAKEFFKKEGDTPQLHGKSLVVKEYSEIYAPHP